MPTYEYLCQTCSHRFETWQKMTDEPLTVCPQCGKNLRKIYYPAGIVFKGSGFYKTDHGNGSHSTSNGETKKAESTSTETSTSESKTSENKTNESKTSEQASTTTPSTSVTTPAT